MQATKSGWLGELLAEHQPPCVSIYLPVAKLMPLSAGAPRHYRDLVDKVRAELNRLGAKDAATRRILSRLEEFTAHHLLREGDREALAIFASPDYFQVIELQGAADEHLEVGDSFHVKPLIRILQHADRYHVLCLGLHNVRLFEGDRYRMDEIELVNVPRRIDETPTAGPGPEGGRATARSGEARSEGTAAEPQMPGVGNVDFFFRAVDRAIWENYSRKYQLPIMLAADPQHFADFRGASKNPYLMDEGIAMNPDGLDANRLREEAWRIVEPRFRDQLTKLGDMFNAAKAHYKGSDDIREVAQAVATGRVGTLLVQADRHIPGKLHRDSGQIDEATLTDPRADDVLDDLAEMVLRMDGEVFVVPPEHMPTDQGVAAVYRY